MTADVDRPGADTPVTGQRQPPRLWVPADGGVSPSEEAALASTGTTVSRRTMLKVGAAAGAGVALAAGKAFVEPALAQKGLLSGNGVFAGAATAIADLVYVEAYPTSPLILEPFKDQLPIPKAMRPVPPSEYLGWNKPPGPGDGQQNSMGNERHQIWPSQLGYPDPIVYKIDVKVATHSFTTSKVLPIDKNGKPAVSYDPAGKPVTAGTIRDLPLSTIYGFNGTFPGPMINAEYGKPALVRFENHLDENPDNLDRQDFGSPDWSFLTHLHNGHTAPESDGNPHYSMRYGPKYQGY
jgi:FtsP/CotA-like multicopper oxidase with cupredoxin domain